MVAKPNSATPRAAEGSPPAGGKPPAGGTPVDEEAHFRLDEHERRMAAMEESLAPNAIAGLVKGAAAVLQGDVEQRLLAAITRDVDTDRKIIEGLAELVKELRALVACMQTREEGEAE